jgi:hypothetical protein
MYEKLPQGTKSNASEQRLMDDRKVQEQFITNRSQVLQETRTTELKSSSTETPMYEEERVFAKKAPEPKLDMEALKIDTSKFNTPLVIGTDMQPAKRRIRHVMTQTPRKQNEDTIRLAHLESQIQELTIENEAHRKTIRTNEANLEASNAENVRVVESMDAQKAKFDKLSATAYKKIKVYHNNSGIAH